MTATRTARGRTLSAIGAVSGAVGLVVPHGLLAAVARNAGLLWIGYGLGMRER